MNKLESAYQAISEAVLNLNLALDENGLVANSIINQIMDDTAEISNRLECLIFNIGKDRENK